MENHNLRISCCRRKRKSGCQTYCQSKHQYQRHPSVSFCFFSNSYFSYSYLSSFSIWFSLSLILRFHFTSFFPDPSTMSGNLPPFPFPNTFRQVIFKKFTNSACKIHKYLVSYICCGFPLGNQVPVKEVQSWLNVQSVKRLLTSVTM